MKKVIPWEAFVELEVEGLRRGSGVVADAYAAVGADPERSEDADRLIEALARAVYSFYGGGPVDGAAVVVALAFLLCYVASVGLEYYTILREEPASPN